MKATGSMSASAGTASAAVPATRRRAAARAVRRNIAASWIVLVLPLRCGGGAAGWLAGKFRNRDDQVCRTDADALDPTARPLFVGSRRQRVGAVGHRPQAWHRCPQ